MQNLYSKAKSILEPFLSAKAKQKYRLTSSQKAEHYTTYTCLNLKIVLKIWFQKFDICIQKFSNSICPSWVKRGD